MVGWLRWSRANVAWFSYKRLGDFFEEAEQLQTAKDFRLRAQRAATDLDEPARMVAGHSLLGVRQRHLLFRLAGCCTQFGVALLGVGIGGKDWRLRGCSYLF